MTPPEVLARAQQALGARATYGAAFGLPTADVAREDWVDAARTARDGLGLRWFDRLGAVDEQAAGFLVVLHLWSPEQRWGLQLQTRCPRDDARVPSLVDVLPGAAWHERETAEMFGIGFDGHPGLVPLLLPEGFAGAPLRKEFVLATRVATPWPGVKEPGESDRDVRPSRRRAVPPGVPAPGTWGTR